MFEGEKRGLVVPSLVFITLVFDLFDNHHVVLSELHASDGSGGELHSLAKVDVDRLAVLLDIWTCEAEFLEHKIQVRD